MLLEAVELYCMMEIVFPTNLNRYIYWVGYGLPALVVVVSVLSNPQGYGTSSHCWLSTERYFTLSFFVPVGLIVVVRFVPYYYLILPHKAISIFCKDVEPSP
uniref:G-protein coupled receptors family 2 profile 2 domain-containing protein n=1 Tax=Callorhinchus milii TaxID=7868 RepID=A0A4W3H0X0_CALMI